MTKSKALEEAERRWGKNAAVRDTGKQAKDYRYSVGMIVMGLMFSVQGQGDTWEEVFAAANKASGI